MQLQCPLVRRVNKVYNLGSLVTSSSTAIAVKDFTVDTADLNAWHQREVKETIQDIQRRCRPSVDLLERRELGHDLLRQLRLYNLRQCALLDAIDGRGADWRSVDPTAR
eukprot:5439510-Amphidinium_carterae.1